MFNKIAVGVFFNNNHAATVFFLFVKEVPPDNALSVFLCNIIIKCKKELYLEILQYIGIFKEEGLETVHILS